MTPNRMIVGWIAIVAYGFVIPVAAGWPWTSPNPAIAAAAITAVYAAVRLAWLLAAHAPFAQGLALAFAYVFLGIAPIAQMTHDRFPWGGSYHDDVLLGAALMGLASVVAIDVGAWLVARRPASSSASDRTTTADRPSADAAADPSAVLWLAVLAALGSALLAIVVIGPGLLTATRQEVGAAICPAAGGYAGGAAARDMASCGVLTSLIRVPPVFAFVIAVSAWRARRAGALVAIALCGAALAITSSPFGTPRAWLAVVLIGSLAPWLVRSIRLRRVTLAAMPLAILLVYPAGDFARTATWAVSWDPARNLTEKADFDVFQQLANGIVYLDSNEPQLGRQLGSAVLFFVPRAAWEDKSFPTGELVAWHAGYAFTNLSAPPALEGYVDFGLAGAMLLSLLVGVAVGALDRAARFGPSTLDLASRSLWMIEIAFLLYLLRGALLPAATYLGPILLVHGALVVATRVRGHATPGPDTARRPETAKAIAA